MPKPAMPSLYNVAVYTYGDCCVVYGIALKFGRIKLLIRKFFQKNRLCNYSVSTVILFI